MPAHFGKWFDAYQSIMVDAFWTVQTAVGTGRHVWARDVLAVKLTSFALLLVCRPFPDLKLSN